MIDININSLAKGQGENMYHGNGDTYTMLFIVGYESNPHEEIYNMS